MRRTALALVPFLLLTPGVPAAAADETARLEVHLDLGRLDLDLSFPFTIEDLDLEAEDGWLRCDCDLDRDTRRMLSSLRRRGESSQHAYRTEESRITARRRGDRLELRIVDREDGGRAELTLPWMVAECLLGKSIRIEEATAEIFRGAGLHLEAGGLRIDLD